MLSLVAVTLALAGPCDRPPDRGVVCWGPYRPEIGEPRGPRRPGEQPGDSVDPIGPLPPGQQPEPDGPESWLVPLASRP
jgi:hypothetical protein